MARAHSGGVLMYRVRNGEIEVYLAHPGGPFFRNRHEGHWGIPKGLLEDTEDERAAAAREFEEETGFAPPEPLVDLGRITQRGGKVVHGFAARWEERADPPPVKSNTCPVEWPPRSGKMIDIPEIDEARFLSLDEARRLMIEQQFELVERLRDMTREQ